MTSLTTPAGAASLGLADSLRALSARAFTPARGLRGGHLQTLFATYFAPTRAPRAAWERWDTPDGDFLDVRVTAAAPERPQVLLLHGLESDPLAAYVRRMAKELASRGMGTWSLAWRGCGRETNRLLRTYHAGETGDARFALARIRARTTGPLFAVGFSLGASALLNLLIEDGEGSPLTAAATVSAPFRLAECADRLDAATDLLAAYRARFLVHLVRKGAAKAARFPGTVDRAALLRARTIRGYDDHFTAPVHGFADAQEYYESASTADRLHLIRRPTLAINATDDPLIPKAALPRFDDAPFVVPMVRESGGHIAFVEGAPWRPRFWAEPLVAEAFERAAAEAGARQPEPDAGAPHLGHFPSSRG